MSNYNYPKLFLFCIGGTGSRVLKALTFLAATGVDIKASKIIPIIIDPDSSNGDVTRTIEILNKYRDIRLEMGFDKNDFFKTEFQTLSSLDAVSDDGSLKTTAQGFRFGIDGTKEGRFREFLAYDQIQGGNKALLSALFTEENLNAELKVGFKGNPHMGSIVLNRFSESDDFKFFASRFNENDRIFIVSSIFGGTGAAGFPLLVKNLRSPRIGLKNPERIRNSRIGAISVKPYFSVKSDFDSKVNASTFISKTKAALEYYHKNITGNNSLNALYYIGDTETLDYNYNEGEQDQKNFAHLVEFLSAMAIVDFMDTKDEKLSTSKAEAQFPVYKEYGLNGDVKDVTFSQLGRKTSERIFQPMTQYAYAHYFISRNLSSFPTNQPWTKGFENSFLSNEFFGQDLKQFNQRFEEWLAEMEKNERGFNPYNLEVNGDLLHTLVEGIQQKKKRRGLFKKEDWDLDDFNGYLNAAATEVGERPINEKFMSLFYQATQTIFNERIKK
ncbi:MAG: hypothetical protein AAF242_12735 [Bacteroidota bacterium]